jgi:hypothetical protein
MTTATPLHFADFLLTLEQLLRLSHVPFEQRDLRDFVAAGHRR